MLWSYLAGGVISIKRHVFIYSQIQCVFLFALPSMQNFGYWSMTESQRCITSYYSLGSLKSLKITFCRRRSMEESII